MRRLVFGGWIGALLALSGCAAGSLLCYRVSTDAPSDETSTVSIAGLSAPVTVTYDTWGVPHLQAQNDLDSMRADGYVQGRARFFEMDMMRRFARGRVSELVGEQPFLASTTTAFDLQMRGWELETRAASDLDKLPPDQRAILDAFAAGVNDALALDEPLEYRLLGTKPAPWTAQDTLVVGLLNAWSVSHNWHQEAVRLVLALDLGLERANQIYPSEPLSGGRTLPSVGAPSELLPAIAPELADLFPAKPVAVKPGPVASRLAADVVARFAGASNGWVVAGSRSSSGKPMLANDPHLTHFLPSIMFQQHLQAPGLDVIGVTIPGVPYVLAGHNQRVAWGMTSTVADVIDLVIEKVDPAHADRVLHEGADCPITSKQVEIRAREGSSFTSKTYTLRRTCTGPVLNDLYPALFPANAPLIAIRWHVHGIEQGIGVLAKADRAGSVAELQDTLGMLPSPVNTWEAADVDGHIGVFLSGTIPIRAASRGTFPVPGWLKKYEWSGMLDTHAMPHAVDPETGYFAHANNLIQDPRYEGGHPVNIDSAPSYRYDRIVELVKATPKQSLDSMAKIQTDLKLERAAHLVPFILADLKDAPGLGPIGEAARAQLAHWDFVAGADSAATAIFFELYRHAVTDALADEVQAPVLEFFLAERYSTNVADGWFESATQPVWDDLRTPAHEGRAAVIREAFAKAIADLRAAQGDDVSTWQWGKLHRLQPRHPFGGKSILAGTVNLEEIADAGGLDSVLKSHFDLGNEKDPFRTMAGPVFRMVVDTADMSHARWIIDTGTSGWPHTPHYGDQFEKWRRGELIPMVSDWAEIKRDAVGVETLKAP